MLVREPGSTGLPDDARPVAARRRPARRHLHVWCADRLARLAFYEMLLLLQPGPGPSRIVHCHSKMPVESFCAFEFCAFEYRNVELVSALAVRPLWRSGLEAMAL